jgi:hypothetical protein
MIEFSYTINGSLPTRMSALRHGDDGQEKRHKMQRPSVAAAPSDSGLNESAAQHTVRMLINPGANAPTAAQPYRSAKQSDRYRSTGRISVKLELSTIFVSVCGSPSHPLRHAKLGNVFPAQ